MSLSAATPPDKFFVHFSRVMQSKQWGSPQLQEARRQESLACQKPIAGHRLDVLEAHDVWAPGDIVMPTWVPAAAAHRDYLRSVAIAVDMGDGRQEFWKPLYWVQQPVSRNDKAAAP